MVTVSDTVSLAFRKLGVLRSGGSLAANELADGISSLTSLYAEWIAQGAFGRVYNVVVSESGSVTPRGNQHINVTTDGEVEVDIPATLPADYWCTYRPCRDYGWGKFVPLGGDPNLVVPRDKSVVMVTDQFGSGRVTYVYDGTVQRWMRTDTLASSDEAPLSARGSDGLAAVLAIRLSETYGSELAGPGTMRAANSYKTALVCNFGSEDRDYC